MKKHILFIDDDEDELMLFIDALNEVNIPYKCTWAKSGEHALKQLTYFTPDIIFLDLNMPCMNGLDCLAAIKRQPHLKACPVVLHSTAMNAEWKSKGMRLGAAACLVKSETSSNLVVLMAQLIPLDPIAVP